MAIDFEQNSSTPADAFDFNLRKIHLFRAKRSLPGPNYYEVLHYLHAAIRPDTYVEIGVNEGDSLQACGPGTTAIGIDPANVMRFPLADTARFFQMTSTEFFERENLPALLGGRRCSLAFIDGLHLWEQALLDFIDLERSTAEDSFILLHDCVPLDRVTAARERTTHFYSGDVWKTTLCIRERRPDLDMVIIPTAPTGLCLISGFRRDDHARTSFAERYPEWVSAYGGLTFDDYRMRLRAMPPRIPNNESAVTAYVAEQLRRRGHAPEEHS